LQKKNKAQEHALQYLVKSGAHVASQFVKLEKEHLDAPFGEFRESLLSIMCKNFDIREKTGIKWLLSKGCDPLLPNQTGAYPLQFIASIAFPAQRDSTDDDDEVTVIEEIDVNEELLEKEITEVSTRNQRKKEAKELFSLMLNSIHPLTTLVAKPVEVRRRKISKNPSVMNILNGTFFYNISLYLFQTKKANAL
jgi:hypothetical protein